MSETHDHSTEIYDWAGLLVRDYVLTYYESHTQVLDVGAGQGKYRTLLRVYPDVDACEIWEPTVVENNLRDIYTTVFVRDFCDLVTSSWWLESGYDLVVMGDVLEHIDTDAAQDAIARTLAIGADVIVIVPFLYPQDEEDGNVYQRHIQDDLTPELMTQRYPQLQLIAVETRGFKPFKGMYVGSGK